MGRHFFDFDDGDYIFSVSDTMAYDSDGNMMMRMSDSMAMDMDSGEIHFISSWSDDEDDKRSSHWDDDDDDKRSRSLWDDDD